MGQFKGEQHLHTSQTNGRSIQDNSVDGPKGFIQDGERRIKEFLNFEIDKSPFWKSDGDGFWPRQYLTDIISCRKELDKKSFEDKGRKIETIFIKSMSNDEDVGVQTEDEINTIRGTITAEGIQGTNLKMTDHQRRKLETKNMLKCWEFFLKIYKDTGITPLTREIIEEGHRILMKGLLGNAGKLSVCKRQTDCPTTNKTINYPTPAFIEIRFDAFMDYANQICSYLDREYSIKGLTEDFVELGVKFHAWFFISFVRLHPFSDGNGRLSRMLHAYLQLSISPAPVGIYNIFSTTSKSDYIRVIVEVRKQHEMHTCEEHWCFNSKPFALAAMILECLWCTCQKIRRSKD